jgi:hypothetical protein
VNTLRVRMTNLKKMGESSDKVTSGRIKSRLITRTDNLESPKKGIKSEIKMESNMKDVRECFSGSHSSVESQYD